MTDDRMTLMELVEKSADEDLVRDMLAYAAERLMELESEAATGAPKGARTAARTAQRNGYRERSTYTSTGDPRRPDRPGDPRIAQGQLLPRSRGSPWSRAGRRRRPSWPSYRKHMFTASRRAPSMTWCGPWAERVCPRAR